MEEQLEAKNLNPAILERVKFYSTHYGLYDHHPVLVKETQLKRLDDIMTYRQAKNLPTRLALGVSNNLGNAQERRRFKDPSWIVADNDVSMLNPAGQAYIVHFIDRVPSMQQLTMWAHKTSHFFDEIVIDKDVHHLIRDFNRIAMIKSILCLKPGGTFQFPLPKPGLGMPKYRRDAPIEDGLPINDAFLEKLLTNPLNIIEQQSYFVGLPIEGQPILRTQRMDFKIFPFLSLPESYFNSDETLAKINHIFLKWFVPYLKKNLTKNNDEPNGLGQDLFSTVDILENQKHHMDIYEGPVDRLFIGTR